MPFQPIVPTWLAWNNCNFPTQSGIQDQRTGDDFPAGGLNQGDYFDATEKEANTCSALANGLLHWGRYRLIQVDSGATASQVTTGTCGFVRFGTFVQNVTIVNAGSGGTPGTYTVAAPPGVGGGSGAVLQVVVGSAGTIVYASVLLRGINYVQPALFTPTGILGLTGASLMMQLNSTPNVVTSTDQANFLFNPPFFMPRIVVFLNSITPGNYGFVQELGLATVLSNASGVGNVYPSGGVFVIPSTGKITGGATNNVAVGIMADWMTGNNQLVKIYMSSAYTPVCQD